MNIREQSCDFGEGGNLKLFCGRSSEWDWSLKQKVNNIKVADLPNGGMSKNSNIRESAVESRYY